MKTINYTITTITATNNIAVAMFADKKYVYKTARNNKVALLETLKAILNKALPSDQLMEKPVLIITTQSILKGFTTGGFLDYVRTGEDANGNKFADDEFQLICECAELYASRALNVRFIDEKMISFKDKEAQTIKQNAYNTVKQLSTKQAVQQTKAKTQAQPVSEVNETIKMINEQIKKALADAHKNIIEVPVVGTTIPHEITGIHDAGKVLLKPAPAGTGIVAGGPVRNVVELAGIQDIVSKSQGSNTPINIVRATFKALQELRTVEEVAAIRGKAKEEIL